MFMRVRVTARFQLTPFFAITQKARELANSHIKKAKNPGDEGAVRFTFTKALNVVQRSKGFIFVSAPLDDTICSRLLVRKGFLQ